MRLTLRTLLAYLDDILEPADAAEMGKKIEESEFATSLMHRTRDVTRRLRIGAPKLYGRGMGLDPNTVAEYLDNTLPSERVPDFEKVCLESDVHLAEVASAHQILALVLGEPAEFDSRGRQRIYALASAPTEDGKEAASSKPAEKASRSRKRKKRRQPKVPAYLREASKQAGGRRWLVAALALVVLAGGAALTVRLAAPDAWRRWTGAEVAVNVSPDGSSAKQAPEAESGVAADSAAKAKSSKKTPSEKNSTNKKKTKSSSAAAKAADDESDNEESDNAAPPEPEVEGASEKAQGKDSAGKTSEKTPEKNSADDEPPVAPMPDDNPLRRPDRKPAAEVPRGELMGRLISEHDVLLRWNRDEDVWQRVPARESVFAGDVLLALPAYQPNVALGIGVTAQLLGGAAIELEPPDAQGVPGIKIIDGRVLLLTVAKPGVQVRVQAGDRKAVAVFGRDDATLAVQVARDLPDGADPEKTPAAVLVDLFLASGEVQWVSPGSGPQKLKAPEHRTLHADPSVPQGDEFPAWIKSNELAPIERRAAMAVDELLPADRPADEALKELAADRKAEISLLAMKSLALIGEFDLFVEMLNTPSQKHAWTPQIESLRAALARGPAVAAQIRQAFEDQRGKTKGAELYRMLWGYDREQLEGGADKQLVEYLNDKEDLDIRVLSFWNLHHMTGFLLGYRPADPDQKRIKGVAAWRQKLSSKQIVPMPSEE
ncbi:MAG TPA: hypothetical protein VMV10_24765 [Pirellulales bacterium]|nr:hypothetical protein [Pirellulales bacterium]